MAKRPNEGVVQVSGPVLLHYGQARRRPSPARHGVVPEEAAVIATILRLFNPN